MLKMLLRSGRPSKQTELNTEVIVQKVRLDRYGREKHVANLAGELSRDGTEISGPTVWRIFKKAGFRKTKPTRKPGLTKRMRDERLKWCLDHAHWTLEDWKNVIWSDETSVVLLHRRGGYKIWRKADEAFVRSCIRERWKGYSEFMFWSCFTYDQKGPCHIWQPETKQEKEESKRVLEEMNEELEPVLREQWELNTPFRRLGLRGVGGPKPTWNGTKPQGN